MVITHDVHVVIIAHRTDRCIAASLHRCIAVIKQISAHRCIAASPHRANLHRRDRRS
jgi:hypothetical protein